MSKLFQVVSYNTLANSYIKAEWYRRTAPELLNWEKRKSALCEKVSGFDVDVICLQELEEDAYELMAARLREKGYQGIYQRKGNDKPDGCATFFQEAGLSFNDSETIYYQDRAKGDLNSGHLALIVSFQSEIGRISIANTHLKWDRKDRAKERHIGYKQLQELLAHIKRDQATTTWVLCGDFNAQPDSPVIKAVLAEGFQDAYQDKGPATCNPHEKAKRLDYIFHTNNLAAKPAKLPRIGNLTPLPSATEPSDHLAIMVSFSTV